MKHEHAKKCLMIFISHVPARFSWKQKNEIETILISHLFVSHLFDIQVSRN